MIKRSPQLHHTFQQGLILIDGLSPQCIGVFKYLDLEILGKMKEPSRMNIYATAAIASLFAGLVHEIPTEILKQEVIISVIQKDLSWELLKYFLGDAYKFISILKQFQNLIQNNQITVLNIQKAQFYIHKYTEINQDNNLSVSHALIRITKFIIKTDQALNKEMPSSPKRSQSASPSPLHQPDLFDDEINEDSVKPERKSVQSIRTPKYVAIDLRKYRK